jgi:NitT/TauT family transport system substrate-binding protein
MLLYTRPAPDRSLLIVAAPAPQLELLPVYLALSLGFFEDDNCDVRVAYGPFDRAGFQGPLLTACRLEDVMYARTLKHERLKAVAVLTDRENAVLLGREQKPFSWTDAYNQSIISGGPSSSTTAILEYALRQNKILPHREVTLMQNIPENLRVPAFLAGTADFLVLYEPEATLLADRNQAFVAARVYLEERLPLVVLAAEEGSLAQNGHVVSDFNSRLDQARQYLYAHTPKTTASLVGPYFPHLSLSTLEKIIQRGQQEKIWNADGMVHPDTYARLQEVLKQAGELPCPVSYEDVFLSPQPLVLG